MWRHGEQQGAWASLIQQRRRQRLPVLPTAAQTVTNIVGVCVMVFLLCLQILIKGHISKAADVYAYGMVLWELYTAQKVFKGIPRALLGHQVTQLNRWVCMAVWVCGCVRHTGLG